MSNFDKWLKNKEEQCSSGIYTYDPESTREAWEESEQQAIKKVLEILESSDLGTYNTIYLIDEIRKAFKEREV